MEKKYKDNRPAPMPLRLHPDYRNTLKKKAKKLGLTLHAYCLMTLINDANKK
jgi:hypothetical protein